MKNKKGFGLVEVVVAVAIISFSIISVWKVYTIFLKLSLSNPSLFQASFLAEEGVEAVKFMRDSGWAANIDSLSTGVPYILFFDGSVWKATTTLSFIDGRFDRRVVFSDVYRDVTGSIAPHGSLDEETKKISVAVSWQKDGATSTREITTYVSNIFKN